MTTERAAGGLLLLSVLLLLLGVAVIAAQGKLGGLAAGFGGIAQAGGDASGLRIIARFALPAILAQVAGFALLTLLLHRAGGAELAVIAFAFLLFSVVLASIEGSFQANVTVWVVEQHARTGTVPEFYEPLRRWANGEIQIVYMSALLTAMLLYSIAILQTGIIASWVGWVSLVWSVIAFPVYFLVLGAPLVFLVHFLIMGLGLLLES